MKLGVWVLSLGAVLTMGCSDSPPVEVEKKSLILSLDRLNGFRYPGEVEVPKDIYKRFFEKAQESITVENMDERLTLLENEIREGVSKK